MKAKKILDTLYESYGAGFSLTSFRGGLGGTSRGGFGGASNLGGPNMMYTYEIKPLNHTLEQKPNTELKTRPSVQIGSRIKGYKVKSNATPTPKEITGIVHKIVKTDSGVIKYYVIHDEATAQLVKIEPYSIKLLINDDNRFYDDYASKTPHSRKNRKI